VKERHSDVAVLNLGGDPSTFVPRLSAQGYFDSLAFSAEDRERGRMYHVDAERKKLEASSTSVEDYLARLEMVANIGSGDDMTIPRIAQLTQKTNQFNLTTRRYSEGEIRALCESSTADVFYLKLRDRLSELGLVGVAIVRYEGEDSELDTFLLSCRAIGRAVEECLLAHCIEAARARGCRRLRGCYFPTAKNAQVREFYPAHSFQEISQNSDPFVWEFLLDRDVLRPPQWIRVETLKMEEGLCSTVNAN
jgi:FkbH-like protein